MKKIILGTAITLSLLLNGCSESEDINSNQKNSAKTEFSEKILSTNIKPIDFKKNIQKVVSEYEKKYGIETNVWLEELKRTDDWKAREIKHFQSLSSTSDFSNDK